MTNHFFSVHKLTKDIRPKIKIKNVNGNVDNMNNLTKVIYESFSLVLFFVPKNNEKKTRNFYLLLIEIIIAKKKNKRKFIK